MGADGAVIGDRETNRWRKLSLELRHQGFNAGNSIDDIGTRLAVDLDQNHGVAVYNAQVPDIFTAIHNAAQIRETDRRPLPVNHHQVLIVLGRKELIASIDWQSNLVV